MAQGQRIPLPMQETWVQSLGKEDPLEKEMDINSSILAWRILWTEEPGRLQTMGSQSVRHDLAIKPPPQLMTKWRFISTDSIFAGVIPLTPDGEKLLHILCKVSQYQTRCFPQCDQDY